MNNVSMDVMTTLDDFTFAQVRLDRDFNEKLGHLLRDISFAAKAIDCEINKNALLNRFGPTGKINVQGEEIKYIDQFANKQMIKCYRAAQTVPVCAAKKKRKL